MIRRAPVVVDTDVVVAGLITSDPDSPAARVLDGMLSGAIPFAVSDSLLGEYRAVLVRPGLRRLHRLSVAEVDDVLVDLARHAIVLRPVAGPAAPDPGDQFLFDLLAAHDALALVTGDKALLAAPAFAHRIRSPRAFLDA